MGRSRRQVVGYKYHFGLHAVLCQGPIDAILQIDFADRTAWKGKAIDQTISVYEPKLFGGDESEGGVSGYVDVLGGGSEQALNAYLDAQLEPGFTPAFRGPVSMVFKQFYWGNNRYPKAWRVKVQNVFSTFESWLPGLAPINVTGGFDRSAIIIALDVSGSMATDDRIGTAKTAINSFLDTLPVTDQLAVRLVAWGSVAESSAEYIGWDETNRSAAKSFVSGLSAIEGSRTYTPAAFDGAETFYDAADAAIPTDGGLPANLIAAANFVGVPLSAFVNNAGGPSQGRDRLDRYFVLITDGEPGNGGINTPQEITDVAIAAQAAVEPVPETHVINIELEDVSFSVQLDSDGSVPVVASDNPSQLEQALSIARSAYSDLNPAHILRDVLINPDVQGDGVEVGSTFNSSAQKLFDEGFGLSYFWQNTADKQSFKADVERTINGVSYFDHESGAWELKLIRPDYEIGDLFTFDGSLITEWVKPPEFPVWQELTNQLTLVYTNRDNGTDASVTVHNTAAIIETGRIIPEKIEMGGITWPELANKVALRELEARGRQVKKGSIRVAYCPSDVKIGSPIIINEPRLNMSNVVCRVLDKKVGDGKKNGTLLEWAEDVWSVDPANAGITSSDQGTAIDYTARAPDVNLLIELPYLLLINELGETVTADELAIDPDLGYWAAGCNQPNSAHSLATAARLDGSTYVSVETGPFLPAWELSSNMTAAADAVTFTAPANQFEGEMAVGELLMIDEEIVRVDAISVDGDVSTFTVGRGVLDTVPAAHSAGSFALAFDGYAQTESTQYSAGESITVKCLPQTRAAQLPLTSAEALGLTFNSRANSPYPVGRLQVDGSYLPEGVQSGTVTMTWAHRDRTMQTTGTPEDHTDGSIGPEAGVSYHLVKRIINKSGATESVAYTTEIELSPDQVLTVDVDLDDVGFSVYADSQSIAVELGIITRRGTSPVYENYQTPFVRVYTEYAQPATLDTDVATLDNDTLTLDAEK